MTIPVRTILNPTPRTLFIGLGRRLLSREGLRAKFYEGLLSADTATDRVASTYDAADVTANATAYHLVSAHADAVAGTQGVDTRAPVRHQPVPAHCVRERSAFRFN